MRRPGVVRRAWRDVLDSLLDRRCPGCGGHAPRDREICDACDAAVPRTGTALCLSCLRGDAALPGVRGEGCPVHGSRRLVLAGPRYEPTLEHVLRAFKYEGARRLAPWLSELLPEPPFRDGPIGRESVLVPVPLHPARRASRGFDQAGEIAAIASRRWGMPCVAALERTRDSGPQARLSGAARRENVRGVFRALEGAPLEGRPVLLVDDVVTTGSTMIEASHALESAGAAWVIGLAAAHGGAPEEGEPTSQASVAAPGTLW